MKILLIDPAALTAEAARLILKSAGQGSATHTVCKVSSIEDAAPGKSAGYEMVLFAPAYPGETSVAEQLRTLRQFTKVPVLTLFAEPVPTIEDRAAATTGGDCFLVWPVQREELLGAVARLATAHGVPLYHTHAVIAAAKAAAAAK